MVSAWWSLKKKKKESLSVVAFKGGRGSINCKTTSSKKQCRAANKDGRENDYLHSNRRLQQQMFLSKCHNGCEKMNVHRKGQMSPNIPMTVVFAVRPLDWMSPKLDIDCHPVFIIGTTTARPPLFCEQGKRGRRMGRMCHEKKVREF